MDREKLKTVQAEGGNRSQRGKTKQRQSSSSTSRGFRLQPQEKSYMLPMVGGDPRQGHATQGYTFGNGKNVQTVAPMFYSGGQPYCHTSAMPWMVKPVNPNEQKGYGHRNPQSPRKDTGHRHPSQSSSGSSARQTSPDLSQRSSRLRSSKPAQKASPTITTVTQSQSGVVSSHLGKGAQRTPQQHPDAGTPSPIPCSAQVMNACMGMYPQTTQAMEAIYTPLPPEWPPRAMHGGEPCPLDDKGIDFKFKPRPDFATEVTFSIEPKKKPMWQKMMRVGFRPMITCGAPPFVLPPNWQTYHRSDLPQNHYPGPRPPQQFLQHRAETAEETEEEESSSSEGSTEESSSDEDFQPPLNQNGDRSSSDDESSETSTDASVADSVRHVNDEEGVRTRADSQLPHSDRNVVEPARPSKAGNISEEGMTPKEQVSMDKPTQTENQNKPSEEPKKLSRESKKNSNIRKISEKISPTGKVDKGKVSEEIIDKAALRTSKAGNISEEGMTPKEQVSMDKPTQTENQKKPSEEPKKLSRESRKNSNPRKISEKISPTGKVDKGKVPEEINDKAALRTSKAGNVSEEGMTPKDQVSQEKPTQTENQNKPSEEPKKLSRESKKNSNPRKISENASPTVKVDNGKVSEEITDKSALMAGSELKKKEESVRSGPGFR